MELQKPTKAIFSHTRIMNETKTGQAKGYMTHHKAK